MVATLYDASLETFAKHYWTQKFSIFRNDYSSANVTFHNQGRSLSSLLGSWNRATVSIGNYRYWAFPPEITRTQFRHYPGMLRQRVMTKSREQMNSALPATMAIAESASVEGLGLAMDAAAIGAGEALDERAATGDFVAQS